MPIASPKPITQTAKPLNLPKIEPEEYKGVIVDDKKTSLKSLIAYIDGAPWVVNYYSQIVAPGNDTKIVDTSLSSIEQPYVKINGFEIRVQSDLQSSTDPDTKISSVVGTGLIYPSLVPNEGDLFIASIPGGVEGLFTVSNVNRKTYNYDSVYEVEYTLIEDLSRNSARYSDIESKVQREYFFHKERLIEGLNPNVIPTEHNDYLKLQDLYRSMCQYYFRTFFNTTYKTLIVPGQSADVYDSFLTNYVMKIVSSFDAPDVRSIKILPIENETYLMQPQFWEVMLQRSINELGYVNQKMGLVDTITFNRISALKGLRYTGLNFIVYPVVVDTSVNTPTSSPVRSVVTTKVTQTNTNPNVLTSLLDNSYNGVSSSIPIITDVGVDDYYVLSANFYNQTNTQSILESLVSAYLKQESIDVSLLTLVCEKHFKWTRLNQFYYIPILLTLIKATVKGL